MADVSRVGDLEIGQDLKFQRREWTVQRVAWVVIGLILVAGLLGLFGSGPLSDAATEAGPLRLDYGRFERKHRPTELRVQVAGDATQQGRFELWLSQPYLDGVDIRSINPEPEQTRAGADRTVYVFQVGDPGRPANVGFDVEPAQIGRLRGRVGLVGGPEVEFGQFVYP